MRKRRFHPPPGRGGREDREGRDSHGDRGGRGSRGGREEGRQGRRENADPPDYWSRLLDHGGAPGRGNEFLEKTVCPACEKTSARILSRLGPTLLKQCRACRVVFISPRLAESVRLEMQRRDPPSLGSPDNLTLRHLMAERLQNMHREMFPIDGLAKGTGSLLEVGCGWGHFLQLCRPHYRLVEGLELSKVRAAHARGRFDLEVHAVDVLQDSWPRSYHVIAAWSVLEKQPHPLEFLRWAHDHLLTGGQLALTTPNYGSLYRRILRSHWYGFDLARNLTYFTPETLRALLLEAGFRDVAIHTSGRSLLREKWNSHNQIDRRQDALGQWLQTLRIRDKIDATRENTALNLKNPLRKIWHGSVWQLVNALAIRGFGDEMRVYARK